MLDSFNIRNFPTDKSEKEDHFIGLHIRQIWFFFKGDMWKQ